MPAGGAKIRRSTLRENRSRYETEAHAFRRWVLSRWQREITDAGEESDNHP